MATAIQRTIEDLKEEALRELEEYAVNLWKEYGVKEIHLKEEMQTWYWKSVPIRTGRTIKYEYQMHWRGMGTSLEMHLEKRRQSILNSQTESILNASLSKAKETVHLIGCYLWSLDKAPGPFSALSLAKSADKAEYLANYLEKKGKEELAASQRRRANLLRRKAAGEDIEIPRRASGAIDRVRAIYADLEKDGKPHARAEYINAGTAAGIHPGTCAVQYAKWKREKPDDMPLPQQENRQKMQSPPKPPWEV